MQVKFVYYCIDYEIVAVQILQPGVKQPKLCSV
jgi:hypothetical protein